MKKTFIRSRKIRYGGITAVLTVLVIAVAVLTNAVFGTLAERYLWYTYLTAETNYDVTEDCYELLGEAFETLAAEGTVASVEIIFCDTAENLQEDSTKKYVYATALSLEERYPEQIKVTCYDIWTNPNTVRQYTTTLNPVTGETVETAIKSTSVIIVAENYHRVYELTEFFVFQDNDTSNLWAYNGEKKLAAGILRAVDPQQHVVCLTNNHGEIFYDYELLYLLDDAGYSISYIDLYNDEIPENCELIISYNPNSDLVADDLSDISEFDRLDDFLSVDGHSFWVFVEDGTPSLPNFETYLSEWGVSFRYSTDAENGTSYRYMVQDTSQSLTSDGYTIYGEAVSTADTVASLADVTGKVVFKNATAMQAAQGFVNNGDGSYTKGDRTLYSLYESGKNAVSWANGKAVSGESAILMSLTEQKTGGASSYVGVVSSVEFSTEEFLQSAVYGNTDALLQAFHAVGKEFTPAGLSIKPFSSLDISTVTTAQMLHWTLGLALTPALIVTVAGIAVLVKRRRT